MKKIFLVFVLLFTVLVLSEAVYSAEKEGTVTCLSNGVVNLCIGIESYSSELAVKMNTLINETVDNLKSIGFKRLIDKELSERRTMVIEIEQAGDYVVRLGIDNTVGPAIERFTTLDGEIGSYEFKCSIYNLSREIVGRLFFLKVKKEGL